jgi:GT2 family glycosyltransferase
MHNLAVEKLPFVTIVVLNYNGKPFLDACFSSVFQISYPCSNYEIIFVDNASTDGSVEYVRNKFPAIRILALDKNYGFTEGNNKGAELANGDFIVFLNNDTVVDKNWLNELVEVSLIDSKIGICGSKIKSMKNRNVTLYNGWHLHVLGGVVPGAFYTSKNKLGEEFNIVGSVQGSSFLVRTGFFKSLGGFDKDYFLYSDEVDLCYRAWISGYYVAYAPNSIVYHYGGGTAGTLNNSRSGILYERLKSSSRIYYGNRNSIVNIIKNFELKNMLSGIIFSSSLILLQCLILLKKSDAEHIKLLMRSCMWPVKNLQSIWKKRLIVQAGRRVHDQELITKKLFRSITSLLKIARFGFLSKAADDN